jgi:YHS domain-containing protein
MNEKTEPMLVEPEEPTVVAEVPEEVAEGSRAGESARDPVCGSQVPDRGNRLSVEYAEERYVFCSAGCLERFNLEPDLFTAGPESASRANRDLNAPATPGAGPHAVHEEAPTDAGPG